MIKNLFLYFCIACLLTGCRALPKRNYMGMTRDQVIDAVAETPKLLDNKLWIATCMNPDDSRIWNRTGTNSNLYFNSLDEMRVSRLVRHSSQLGVWHKKHWSGRNFYYELTLENDKVVEQEISSYGDGIYLLPLFVFFDLW